MSVRLPSTPPPHRPPGPFSPSSLPSHLRWGVGSFLRGGWLDEDEATEEGEGIEGSPRWAGEREGRREVDSGGGSGGSREGNSRLILSYSVTSSTTACSPPTTRLESRAPTLPPSLPSSRTPTGRSWKPRGIRRRMRVCTTSSLLCQPRVAMARPHRPSRVVTPTIRSKELRPWLNLSRTRSALPAKRASTSTGSRKWLQNAQQAKPVCPMRPRISSVDMKREDIWAGDGGGEEGEGENGRRWKRGKRRVKCVQ